MGGAPVWGTPSVPMFSPMAGVGFVPMYPMAGVVGSEGWPRPLATPEPPPPAAVETSPPWKNRDDRSANATNAAPPWATRGTVPTAAASTLGGASLRRQVSRPHLDGQEAEARKRAPREWRTDFSLNSSGLLGGCWARARDQGRSGGWSPVELHRYLQYSARGRRCTSTPFRAMGDRVLTNFDLTRFVCEPPLPHMRLFHAHFPWYIDVEAQNPSGVTLYELFYAICECMARQIENADYYNVEMNTESRGRVSESWGARCRTEEERQQGIRRVDFLMGRVIMEGIQKAKDGLWEIKTKKLPG
ncbi:uncharacterized protein BXZ73DRAFT_92408 [Epithele typhae]|uniref:uncharacterized protein n=1 Tax=Epithele typhae TaxID=378194 RepID=UPI002007CDA8|nr:uncharacterized protein BXZ73DRAFT_92408 [Epithele typhae]KAH9916945.1 hypothetical protein BXZ73DRAFT_92408 [Epithele typhae]